MTAKTLRREAKMADDGVARIMGATPEEKELWLPWVAPLLDLSLHLREAACAQDEIDKLQKGLK